MTENPTAQDEGEALRRLREVIERVRRGPAAPMPVPGPSAEPPRRHWTDRDEVEP
ncbi:MAG: hypothetical protein QM704_14895 [Anaeromyxobacteraceae bacterium]